MEVWDSLAAKALKRQAIKWVLSKDDWACAHSHRTTGTYGHLCSEKPPVLKAPQEALRSDFACSCFWNHSWTHSRTRHSISAVGVLQSHLDQRLFHNAEGTLTILQRPAEEVGHGTGAQDLLHLLLAALLPSHLYTPGSSFQQAFHMGKRVLKTTDPDLDPGSVTELPHENLKFLKVGIIILLGNN